MTLFLLLTKCIYRNAFMYTGRHFVVLVFVLFCFFHCFCGLVRGGPTTPIAPSTSFVYL